MDRLSQTCATADATTKYRPTNGNPGLSMQGEQILGIVYSADGVVGRLSLLKTYDLIFTDRRLVGAVVAKTGAASVIGGSLGGAIGGAIARSVAKGGVNKRRANYAGLPLDNIVASDKANFSAPYDRIENVKFKGLGRKFVHMKVEGKKAVFKLPKDQRDQAKSLVASRIPGARV